MCKRRFSTKAALAQHRRDAHGAGGPPRRLPAPRPASRKSAGISAVAESGRDIFTTITLTAGLSAGKILTQQILSPRLFTSSRVHQVAALWARWRPRKLAITLVAGGSYSVTGTIMVGWNADTTPTLVDGAAHIQVATYKPSVSMRLNETRVLNVPLAMSRKWYHTSGASDEMSHGSFVAVVGSAIGGFRGNFQVQVILDWSFEFEGPEFAPSSSGGKDHIKPDAGWHHLFTTSDGSFDAERLTLKMTAGGSMVPFSAALPGYVYQPDGDTKISYYDEAKALKWCKYFTLVQDYSLPGLVCHASAQDAKDYVQTGDKTKIIPYTAAGPWATPDVPSFVGVPAPDIKVTSNVVDQLTSRLAELEAELQSLRVSTGLADAPTSSGFQQGPPP